MALMPITDSMFLLGETREHPLHLGALKLFELPPGADQGFVGALHRQMLQSSETSPLFQRRPRRPVSRLGQWAWTNDDQVDLDYHVRLSALPTPGRIRELLELISRLHARLLDRHRPLWEFHLVEGVEGNQFAMYTKMHHALLDGVSALRLLRRTLSEDPDDREMAPPWAMPAGDGVASDWPEVGVPHVLAAPWRGMWAAAQLVGDMAALAPGLARAVNDMLRSQAAMLPFQAPKTMFNVPITGARRFAAQSWPAARLRAVGRATDSTVNDVVLTMVASALRRYLLEFDALPERPLVAAAPVWLRADDKAGGGVGLILCDLATHLADDAARLIEISGAMRRGKKFYEGMSPLQVTALSAIPIVPLVLHLLPRALRITPPPFNVIISSVPGPPKPLYFNGARMTGLYPVSVPYDGQALNITVTSYAGNLEFGLIACRHSVPHLQRMLNYLEDSLVALEDATRSGHKRTG